MTEIKLLSIKLNEEASYFYNEAVPTTFDSNRNKVVETQENHPTRQISKKETKKEEKRSRKEQKQKAKELKQKEKDKRRSLKNSRKEVVGSVDTGRPNYGRSAEIENTDGVKTTGGFQVAMNFDAEGKDKNDESTTEHEKYNDENEESKESNDDTRNELEKALDQQEGTLSQHEDVPNQHEEALDEHEDPSMRREDSSKEHEQIESEHDLSIKTHEESAHEIANLIGHASTSGEPGTSGEKHDAERISRNRVEVVETIRSEGAHTTEDAPPDAFYTPTVYPEIPEQTGGQHVEIEITDITDIDVDTSSSDQAVVMHYSPQSSTHMNGAAYEGQIIVATVQQVESGLELDDLFADCNGPDDDTDKEEKRKSVRFQEETEEIGHGQNESRDHEHASLNLGGDFTGSSDDNSAEPTTRSLEPTVEIVNREQRSEVESCVDLDKAFEVSPERDPNATENVPNQAERNGNVVPKVNGRAKVNGTSRTKMVEIDLNDSNEHKNAAVMKKEKRKRSGLVRCCFP